MDDFQKKYIIALTEELEKLHVRVQEEYEKHTASEPSVNMKGEEGWSQEEIQKVMAAELEEFKLSMEIWRLYNLVCDGVMQIRMDIGHECQKYLE